MGRDGKVSCLSKERGEVDVLGRLLMEGAFSGSIRVGYDLCDGRETIDGADGKGDQEVMGLAFRGSSEGIGKAWSWTKGKVRSGMLGRVSMEGAG